MPSYTAEEYQVFVRRCLEPHKDRVVEALKAFFCQNRAETAAKLEIVILPRGILHGLPVRLTFKDQPIPGGNLSLAEILGPLLTPVETDLVYRYDDNGVETLEIELQILIEWVSACWLAANGPDMPGTAWLNIENDLETLDLKTMQWIPNPTQTD